MIDTMVLLQIHYPDDFSEHKIGYKNGQKNKITTCHILFNKHGIENCKIELVELFSCNSKEELGAREGFYIRQNICVNKIIPYKTEDEHKEYERERHQKSI